MTARENAMSPLETVDEIPWDDQDSAEIDAPAETERSDGEPASDSGSREAAGGPEEPTVGAAGDGDEIPWDDQDSSEIDAPAAAGESSRAPEPAVAEATDGLEEERETSQLATPPAPVTTGDVVPAMPAPAGDRARAAPDAALDEDFFEEDDEPFDRPGAEKLGIVGGKGVGKSYLFQAMVYRSYAGTQSGALTYYLEGDAVRLFSALKRKDRASTVNLVRFIKNYSRWHRLPQTTLMEQRWYRLRLPYRTGLFGQRRSALDVEFFDGSGEGFFQAVRDADNRRLWKDGYLDARVMVFCLPLWVVFPDFGLPPSDWETRDEVLEGFEQVVQNYTDLRTLNHRTHPVCSILALTMADDRRSGLKTLRDRWISPYIDSAPTYLRRLRRGSGVARYLANARKVSEALHEEFANSRDPLIAAIPQKLDFHGGKPWLIPVSAIEGSLLEGIESKFKNPGDRPRLPPPVPAHVELPLLVALCERDNALM